MSGELLFGIHAVDAALTHDPGNVLELYIESDSHNARLKELSDRARDLGVKPHSRPREALDRMTGGARHQGAVARYRRRRRARRANSTNWWKKRKRILCCSCSTA